MDGTHKHMTHAIDCRKQEQLATVAAQLPHHEISQTSSRQNRIKKKKKKPEPSISFFFHVPQHIYLLFF